MFWQPETLQTYHLEFIEPRSQSRDSVPSRPYYVEFKAALIVFKWLQHDTEKKPNWRFCFTPLG